MARFTLHYASWEQLPPDVQGTFAEIVDGSLDEAEEFYRLYFYWFNVLHEMGHVLRRHLGTDTLRRGECWREEQAVNDVAVAFWRRFGDREWLGRVGAFAERGLATLPDPVPDGADPEEYFDANYASLVPQPRVYGWFQLSFVRSSLERRPDFVPTLRRCVWEESIEAEAAADLRYPRLHEDLPRQILDDLGPILRAHGIAMPPVGLVKAFTPQLAYVTHHDGSLGG